MRERSVGPTKAYRDRTVIVWREAALAQGQVEAHIVIIMDATLDTTVIRTAQQALALADTLRAAAGID